MLTCRRRTRLCAGLVTAAALGALPIPASAQPSSFPAPTPTPTTIVDPDPLPTPTAGPQDAPVMPEPVIDRAPRRVSFDRTARIRGHLEDGAPEMEVTLERRKAGGEWQALRTKTVDENAEVRFKLRSLRRSALYRLAYVDEASGGSSYSDAHEMLVEALLRVRVAPRHPYAGDRIVLLGALRPDVSGRRVIVYERRDGRWMSLGRAVVRDGRFRFSLSSDGDRNRTLQVRFAGDGFNPAARRARFVQVFNPDLATWYGPGFYGNGTACGQTLRTDTLGVAHRSLPCGTEVTIVYRGRSITVPIIDRGPYTSAEWDLTGETARRLRFSGTDTVGTDH